MLRREGSPAMGYLMVDLYVRDVQESLRYYRDVLGFEVRGELTPPDQPTVWAWVTLGGCQIMFTSLPSASAGEFAKPPEFRQTLAENRWGVGATLFFRYAVPDVDAFYQRLAGKATVLEPPHTTSYGWRELTLVDPDGYRLAFSQDAPVDI